MAHVNKHVLVTGYLAEAPGPDYVPSLHDWFRRLVEAVDMKVLIDPICVWCDDEGNEGVTGMVGITTSHSSIHFWSGEGDKPAFYKFDLYSCKDFQLEDVAEMLKEFGTTRFTYIIVNRDDDKNPIIDSGEIWF